MRKKEICCHIHLYQSQRLISMDSNASQATIPEGKKNVRLLSNSDESIMKLERGLQISFILNRHFFKSTWIRSNCEHSKHTCDCINTHRSVEWNWIALSTRSIPIFSVVNRILCQCTIAYHISKFILELLWMCDPLKYHCICCCCGVLL